MENTEKLTKKERKEVKKEETHQMFEKEKKIRAIKKWGTIAVIACVTIGFFWWLITTSSKPLPGQTVADLGRDHVKQEEWEKFKYNSNPPSSGSHDATWIKKGIYTTPQGEGYLIHSLEHGYIALHYNCNVSNSERGTQNQELSDPAWSSKECKNLISQLKDIIKNKTDWKMIVVPNPEIKTKIAVVAWGRIDTMNTVNRKAIEAFIDAYRDHGPEKTMEP